MSGYLFVVLVELNDLEEAETLEGCRGPELCCDGLYVIQTLRGYISVGLGHGQDGEWW